MLSLTAVEEEVGSVGTPTDPSAGKVGVGGSGSHRQFSPTAVTTAELSVRKMRLMRLPCAWPAFSNGGDARKAWTKRERESSERVQVGNHRRTE